MSIFGPRYLAPDLSFTVFQPDDQSKVHKNHRNEKLLTEFTKIAKNKIDKNK